MSRPAERIPRMLDLLRRAWLRAPDQRLGQIIGNAGRDPDLPAGQDYRDPFNVSDDQMWAGLERMAGKATRTPVLDEFDRLDDERWERIDTLAAERGMDPPSERCKLVERVAWGMHAARGLGSPRAAWAEMPEDERVEMLLQATGAIAGFERHAAERRAGTVPADPMPVFREEDVRPLWDFVRSESEVLPTASYVSAETLIDNFPAPEEWKR